MNRNEIIIKFSVSPATEDEVRDQVAAILREHDGISEFASAVLAGDVVSRLKGQCLLLTAENLGGIDEP